MMHDRGGPEKRQKPIYGQGRLLIIRIRIYVPDATTLLPTSFGHELRIQDTGADSTGTAFTGWWVSIFIRFHQKGTQR